MKCRKSNFYRLVDDRYSEISIISGWVFVRFKGREKIGKRRSGVEVVADVGERESGLGTGRKMAE